MESSPSFFARVRRAIVAFVIIYLAWIVFLRPLLSSVPSISAGATYSALFFFGIVASLSTCLATTGAFLLAYGAERKRTLKETILVQAGRLIAFAVGGGLLGAIGGAIPSSPAIYGALGLVLGIGFLWVGLHLLEFAPSLASRGIHLPVKLYEFADRIKSHSAWYAPALVGAITFVLPCGFTQTAQTLALAGGSVTKGALMMTMFALGTLPVLTGISLVGSLAGTKKKWLTLVTGAVLVVFGIGQLDGALTVFGSRVTFTSLWHSLTASDTNQTIGIESEQQVVRMRVAYGAFSPDVLVVKKGVPVRWEINGVDVYGCASSIVVPSYGIRRNLVRGLNVITFTPTRIGTIPFSCSMGMIRGSFRVVE